MTGQVIFRAMKMESGLKPAVGASRRTLGAIPGDPPLADIPIDSSGGVAPGTGGMSVAPDDPLNLPHHRRPREFGGFGRDPIFRFEVELLPISLKLRIDRATHGLIEAARPWPFQLYQNTIHLTQPHWALHDV